MLNRPYSEKLMNNLNLWRRPSHEKKFRRPVALVPHALAATLSERSRPNEFPQQRHRRNRRIRYHAVAAVFKLAITQQM